jgi:hypothetical protein
LTPSHALMLFFGRNQFEARGAHNASGFFRFRSRSRGHAPNMFREGFANYDADANFPLNRLGIDKLHKGRGRSGG